MAVKRFVLRGLICLGLLGLLPAMAAKNVIRAIDGATYEWKILAATQGV